MASRNAKASVTVMEDLDLLEDIILRLPVREILFLKAVSKGWKRVYEESIRIQKVLFLMPAVDKKIYYPNSIKPTWYLAPERDELIAAGLVSAPDEWSDDEVTPTNSPRPQNAKTAQVGSVEREVTNHGKFKTRISFITGDERKPEGKTAAAAVVAETGGEQTGKGFQIVEQNSCKTMVLFESDTDETTGEMTDDEITMEYFDTQHINIFGQRATGAPDGTPDKRAAEYAACNNLPMILASPDGKMMVSRVTPPFINPFCELFLERYFRGVRGAFHPTKFASYPGKIPHGTLDMDVRPPIMLPDGTTKGASKKTQAVQRRDASWRKMHPFSATTSSIEVECFDFGSFEVFLDHGMLCGHMMDQLGDHWAHVCPDCCIPDFWFSEFIKDVCHTDSSHWNRGKHGVKKLGLDNSGWAILAKLGAGPVKTTGIKDRIRPF